MSLTRAMLFDCPYCMAHNEVDIDEVNDVGQTQVLDCQVCCQPVELTVNRDGDELALDAVRENE